MHDFLFKKITIFKISKTKTKTHKPQETFNKLIENFEKLYKNTKNLYKKYIKIQRSTKINLEILTQSRFP